MLNGKDLKFAVEKLGFVPTVDLFALHINTQLEKFMSYRPDPKCAAVDSFTQSLDRSGILCFPTFYMHTQGDAENMKR